MGDDDSATLRIKLHSTDPEVLLTLKNEDLKAELDYRDIKYTKTNKADFLVLLLQNNYELATIKAVAEAKQAAAVAAAMAAPPTQSASSQPIIGDMTAAMKTMFDQF